MDTRTFSGHAIDRETATDPDGDVLTFRIIGDVANEILRLEPDGSNAVWILLREKVDREVTAALTSHQDFCFFSYVKNIKLHTCSYKL